MVSGNPVARFFSPVPRGILPLLPIAPAIVVVVGITAALVIAVLGLSLLQQTADDEARLQARAIAATVAARLGGVAAEERGEILKRSAQRPEGSRPLPAVELLLVDRDGAILVNTSVKTPSPENVIRLLGAADGETRTALGRVRFVARPLRGGGPPLSIIAFVAAPSPPPGSIALVNGVAALTALLLGIAVSVSLAYTKAARDDVDYVRRRIADMARGDGGPAGEPIPIRSLDQVGALTAAFNVLVGRFAAAERSYRADLRQAAEGARERSEFLAGLSHELRTPLNAILGFTHVLESEVDGPLTADARESLQVIKTSGEHLKTLIDDVLDLSALETGQLRLNRRPIDVRELAEEVVREARAAVRDKPVGLAVTGQGGLHANADPRRIRQILTNLITNAIKATAQGWVTVHIEARGGFVAIVVQDTGAGIPPEERAAIFQAYRQAGDERSRRGGTGLGLSIAQRLVGMHGGTIDLESAVGRGSTFSVCLPRVEGAEVELMSRPDTTFPSGSWTSTRDRQ
jgi:signal transduction histidine kinase